MKIPHSKTYTATPPGVIIKERQEIECLSDNILMSVLKMNESQFQSLLKGKMHLTSEIARDLERVLGTKAAVWNKMEQIYRKKLQLVIEENKKDLKRKKFWLLLLNWISYILKNA